VTVEVREHPSGARLLVASGELDVAVVPDLLPQSAEMLAGASSAVLDLSAVTFFDSSGVRLVDRLLRECAAAGAPLRVVAPPGGMCRRVLEIVGMTGDLVRDDLPGAVASALAAAED
jgi:anti-sigma B factor antagonist